MIYFYFYIKRSMYGDSLDEERLMVWWLLSFCLLAEMGSKRCFLHFCWVASLHLLAANNSHVGDDQASTGAFCFSTQHLWSFYQMEAWSVWPPQPLGEIETMCSYRPCLWCTHKTTLPSVSPNPYMGGGNQRHTPSHLNQYRGVAGSFNDLLEWFSWTMCNEVMCDLFERRERVNDKFISSASLSFFL